MTDNRFAYVVPEGTVYVTILPGRDVIGWNETEHKTETLDWPKVLVTTDEEDAPGHLVIRGRKYRIDEEFLWTPPSQRVKGVRIWQRDVCSERDGYLNEEGNEVGSSVKARSILLDLTDRALAEFEAERHDWRNESARLLFEQRSRYWRQRALSAQAELKYALKMLADLDAGALVSASA
ncbi:hypothetical protein [Actinocorallia libanotica]|uniref:Bacteriocin resistance YdeI/OmpD-like protein n=1 Tax=Actinocorallia libanotica TaxID=46162 RepID=A0ABN1QQD7_9ACTN